MMIRALIIILCFGLFAPLISCNISTVHVAAYEGDTKAVLNFLDQGNDVETVGRYRVDHSSSTLLFAAAAGGHVETMQALLARGGSVNSRGTNASTPLTRAAEAGHLPMVQFLLSHGASAVLKTNHGKVASFYAEQKGHYDIVRLLEQAEARELGFAQSPAALPQVAVVSPTPAVPAMPVSDVDRVPAVKTTAKKNAYAVVIGIEQYREELPKANFAAHDASVVGDYVTKVLGYPEENVVVRLNEKATKTDMEKYFEGWLPNNVEKDSSVFIYFSGHGSPHVKTGDAYLVPYDGDPTFVDKTGFSLKRLYAALDKLPAKDVTVVLDSCFSGAGGRSVLAEGARPMGLSIETQAITAGRITVLAASSGDQISNTFKEQGHGLLTYFFLKGLQGEGDGNKDGSIEMVELLDYVKPNVQRIARKQYNNEQTPQLLASPEVLKRGGGRLLERTRP